MTSSPFSAGKAYLVGAGPGDPELLTLKAQRILSQADVVLYDYLVDSRILMHCSPNVELIYVGKSGITGHTKTQEEIQDLIVEYCQTGKSVCRLKGGDPYLFGRGGEEGEVLHQAGIPFEIVPGISSSFAAPAYAGIPITHRDFASSVSIITGHEHPDKPDTMLDWPTLAKMSGTLVFLMGIKQLPEITRQLIQNGKSSGTPVALVRWGTRPQQTCLTGTLETIADLAIQHNIQPPCVIVVGEVVSLRNSLNWFETLPLFGKTIVITRARQQASQLRQQLESLGAQVIEFPTIAIQPAANPAQVQADLKQIRTYDWLIFTSPNGVEHTFNHLFDMGLDARQLGSCKIAAIGPATAAKLMEYALKADLTPKVFVAEAIFDALIEQEDALAGKRFLLPRADIARDDLVIALQNAGAEVTQVPIYQTICETQGTDLDGLAEALANQEVDLITFTSASTATNFAARLSSILEKQPDLLKQVQLASIGPITSESVLKHLGRVDIEATNYTIPGLIDALLQNTSRAKAPALV